MTEQCLLSPTRNPNLDRAGIEHLLKVRMLGFRLHLRCKMAQAMLLCAGVEQQAGA